MIEKDILERILMKRNLSKNNKLFRLFGLWIEGLVCGMNVIS